MEGRSARKGRRLGAERGNAGGSGCGVMRVSGGRGGGWECTCVYFRGYGREGVGAAVDGRDVGARVEEKEEEEEDHRKDLGARRRRRSGDSSTKFICSL